MKRLRIHLTFVAVAVIALAAASPAAAQCNDGREGQLSKIAYHGTALEWGMVVEHQRVTLTVAAPCGLVFERAYEKGENPLFDLRDIPADPDGRYHWQLRIDPAVDSGLAKEMAAAHASGSDGRMLEYQVRQKGLLPEGPFVQSGSFQVIEGSIVEPTQEERSSAGKVRASITDGGVGVRPAAATDCPFAKAAPAVETARIGSIAPAVDGGGSAHPLAFAAETPRRMTALDQVIPDDLIVQSSLCVGFDCVNGESFSFDTIRLKENNLRIKFEDTSTTAGFPTTDWQLTANDSASGGANKFSIEDISGSRVPFTIRGGAATNSIFVDSTGRVGLRTSTPVLDLHISTSNTPGMRLEQTSAGGFTAQTWDIAGNEANFFVRDVTGGSRLPFRIRPGAPTSSIDISNDGDVGIGTASPDEKLHVFENVDANTMIVSENENTGTGAAGVLRALSNTAIVNFQAHGSGRTLTRFGETLGGWGELLHAAGNGLIIGTLGAQPLILGANNQNVLEITPTGQVLHLGGQVHPDYVFEATYELPSIEEHADYMWQNKHLPKVGRGEYSEDGRAVYDLFHSRNGMLEELETAHIYIDQLNTRLTEKEELLAALEEKNQRALGDLREQNADLAKRLAQLEALLEQSQR